MERKKDKFLIPLLYVFFLFGVGWHYLPATRSLMIDLTWIVLFILAAIVILKEYRKQSDQSKTKFISWVGFGFIFTLILEIIGTKTGLIFGDYTYGSVLGLKVLDAPVIIGLNWVVVVLGAIKLSQKVKTKWLRPIMAAILAVCFDAVLEPIAVKFNYWNWFNPAGIETSIVPWQNYLAWFSIALILAAIWEKLELKQKSNIAVHAFIIQLIFLILLLPLEI